MRIAAVAILLAAQPVINDSMSIVEIQRAIRGHIIEEATPMTLVRRPQFSAGDIVYSSGNPVYDGGADLGTASTTANWYGDASVAAFCQAGEGVRYAFTGDSQVESGPARAIAAISRTFELTWSRMFVSVGSNDPLYMDLSGGGDIYQANQYTDTTETSTSGKTVAQIFTDEGIGDPTQIPMRWAWTKRTTEGNQMMFGTAKDVDDAQPDYFYDPGNFDGTTGTKINQRIAFAIAGSTDAPDEIRFRQEYYDNTPTLKGEYASTIASLDAITGSTVASLSGTNNSAKLIMVAGDVKTSYPSQSNLRPRCSLYKATENYLDKTFLLLGGQFVRYESDGTTEEDNTSICLVRSASSMNMANFIHGASINGLSTRNTHGGDRTTRSWMWENFADPNVLVYTFGHNNTYRSGTGFKAESVVQADMFDGILQDCYDYYAVHSEWPRIIIIAPWKGGSMDSDRHAEWLGVVDGLRGHGIPTIAYSLWNYWGGDSFSGASAHDGTGSEYWKNATRFETDGVHPNSLADARIAWYAMKTIMDEAADAYNAGGMRSRDRSRLR